MKHGHVTKFERRMMWTPSRLLAASDEQECQGKDPQLHWMGKGKRLRTMAVHQPPATI